MKTTFRGDQSPDYLGADLTDRHARGRRAIDVCGLICARGNLLRAAFWHWEWSTPQEPLDVSMIAPEVKNAKSSMLDGPQGLASIGKSLRACERQSGAVGKTPDTMPKLGRPFAGYIRSSIELFSAFAKAGFKVSPADFIGGVSEVYPGNIWGRLAKRVLPKKSTTEGRRGRKLILQALGVTDLPTLPTHDENDACICALLAAAAGGKVPGVTVCGLGLPLVVEADGTMREGPMVTVSSEFYKKNHDIKGVPFIIIEAMTSIDGLVWIAVSVIKTMLGTPEALSAYTEVNLSTSQPEATIDTPRRVFIFQCSSETYLACIEKSVFGSDKPWALEVKKGDFCLLHHYDAGSLFGLWRADSNSGKNLVPKAWSGRYPYQVKVKLASAKIIDVPKKLLSEFDVDPFKGRFDSVVDEEIAKRIVDTLILVQT